MDVKEVLSSISENVTDFFSFIADKLRNYSRLSLGEQIAYPTAAFGLLLILTSVVLFIL